MAFPEENFFRMRFRSVDEKKSEYFGGILYVFLYKRRRFLYNTMANENLSDGEIAMALIEYDEYKQKLRDLGPELDKLSAALDMDGAQAEAAKLEDETAQDGFWNDLERSQKVQQRLKQLQNKIARHKKLMSEWEDLTALCEMGQEAEDEELLAELKEGYAALEEKVERFDYDFQKKCVENRDFEALEMYVMNLLMGLV